LDNILNVCGKNHINPTKNLIKKLFDLFVFNLISPLITAIKIKNNTKIFNQTGRKIVGGNEKINHIIFIPPTIENGNKNIIPLIIK